MASFVLTALEDEYDHTQTHLLTGHCVFMLRFSLRFMDILKEKGSGERIREGEIDDREETKGEKKRRYSTPPFSSSL